VFNVKKAWSIGYGGCMSMMGRVKYEILHIQTAEVFGRVCKGNS
jgi:hypothetical protein